MTRKRLSREERDVVHHDAPEIVTAADAWDVFGGETRGVLLRVIDGLGRTPAGRSLLAGEVARIEGYREDAEQERIAIAQRRLDAARDKMIERLRARARAAGRA